MEINELFEYNGSVDILELDDDLRNHLQERGTYQKHIVSLSEILEVHRGSPRYFLNNSKGKAPAIMLGPTLANRFLCVPIEPTGKPGIWRPVIAFEANTHHKERYERLS